VRRVALDAPAWAKPAFGVELTLADVESAPEAERGSHAHGRARSPRSGRRAASPYQPLPATPAAEFDLALLVPAGVTAADVERVLRAAAGDLLERLTLFDEYRPAGESASGGERSLAWRLTLRHPERTLRDKEIAGRREKLLRTLEGELGVRQRTT
jgi:phenylalanyl-tRNA synthetase beta chain